MPKHNIAAIAAVAYTADSVFVVANSPVEGTERAPFFEDLDPAEKAEWTTRVLHQIHGSEQHEQAGGTPDEQRRSRLFAAIVKALTVRL